MPIMGTQGKVFFSLGKVFGTQVMVEVGKRAVRKLVAYLYTLVFEFVAKICKAGKQLRSISATVFTGNSVVDCSVGNQHGFMKSWHQNEEWHSHNNPQEILLRRATLKDGLG
jgi:hypothetical protein